MKQPATVKALNDFGRTLLSKTFFLRDFLFLDISAIHGLANVSDDPELAIAAGIRLGEDLLEPLQDRFGRLAIRSVSRSSAVNAYGNEHGYNCARDEANYADHIWDRRDAEGRMGTSACKVVSAFWNRFQAEGDWCKLAWWICDHLPYRVSISSRNVGREHSLARRTRAPHRQLHRA